MMKVWVHFTALMAVKLCVTVNPPNRSENPGEKSQLEQDEIIRLLLFIVSAASHKNCFLIINFRSFYHLTF